MLSNQIYSPILMTKQKKNIEATNVMRDTEMDFCCFLGASGGDESLAPPVNLMIISSQLVAFICMTLLVSGIRSIELLETSDGLV